jgi:hypothetical protein
MARRHLKEEVASVSRRPKARAARWLQLSHDPDDKAWAALHYHIGTAAARGERTADCVTAPFYWDACRE